MAQVVDKTKRQLWRVRFNDLTWRGVTSIEAARSGINITVKLHAARSNSSSNVGSGSIPVFLQKPKEHRTVSLFYTVVIQRIDLFSHQRSHDCIILGSQRVVIVSPVEPCDWTSRHERLGGIYRCPVARARPIRHLHKYLRTALGHVGRIELIPACRHCLPTRIYRYSRGPC